MKSVLRPLLSTLAMLLGLAHALPAQDTALIRAAQDAVMAGDLAACPDICAAAVSANPDSASAHFFLGLCHASSERHTEAIASYTTAIQLEPYVPEAWLERARSHHALGRTDAALKDIRQTLKQDHGYVDALMLRAEILMGELDFSAALEDLDLAKRFAPRDPEVYCLRAELFWTLGDIKASLKEAHYAVKLAPADPMPYITRANAQLMAGAPTAALADADKAIELAPEAHSLRSTRAYIRMELAQWDEAHADLDFYLAKDSLAYDAHLTRALLHERKGDLSQAVLAVLRADSLRPDDAAIREQLGFLHLRLGHDSLAVKVLEPVVAAEPTRAFALSALGLAHARTGKPQEGLKELDRAIKIDDYDPRAYYHRALIHFLLDKKDKGCEDLDEAEAIGFSDFYGPEELEAARGEHCGG